MKRKNFEFPTAYTVLFLILILVTILTHIIPAGKYDRLSYQQDTKEFVIEKYGNENITLEATQENLYKLNINSRNPDFEQLYCVKSAPNHKE